MCRSLRVEGRRLMDMGAGDGQFMVSALANGARMVMGCEHPQNHAQQLILLSVLEGMPKVLDGFDFKQYPKSSSCCKILIRHLPAFSFLPFNTKTSMPLTAFWGS